MRRKKGPPTPHAKTMGTGGPTKQRKFPGGMKKPRVGKVVRGETTQAPYGVAADMKQSRNF